VGASYGSRQLTEEAVVRRSFLLFVVLAMLVSAAPARAGGGDHRDSRAAQRGHGDRDAIVPAGLAGAPLLTEWWRRPLSLPANDPANPWETPGCPMFGPIALDYGGKCTIRQGTWLFTAAFTVECSNIEADPFHADNPLEAALCGLRNDRLVTKATLTLDGGKPVSVLGGRFDMFMLPGRVVVPKDGVFGGTPGAIMRYGGHGFLAFVRGLSVGKHTLRAQVEGTVEGIPDEGFDATTEITVTR
jgi:hypothetical protein